MDGTLIDSSNVIANSINHVRKQLALPPMENSQIISCINNVNIHAPSFFYEVPEFTKKHEVWFGEYYQAYHHIDTILYEGIESLLEKLQKTHKLSVATNAYKAAAKQMLDAKNISRHFDIVMCADEVKEPKPHKEMIETIIDYYGGVRDEFVVIGDGERDIMAAKNAGVDSLLVNWGFSDHESGAIRTVDELESLIFSF